MPVHGQTVFAAPPNRDRLTVASRIPGLASHHCAAVAAGSRKASIQTVSMTSCSTNLQDSTVPPSREGVLTLNEARLEALLKLSQMTQSPL